MEFENNDAAAGSGASPGGPGNDVASPLPNQAPAAPPIPPPPPAAQPAPQTANAAAPLPAHENRPTHSFAEAIRHALIAGTIGVTAKLAGPAPVDYSVDASGKTVGTPRTDTTTSRLERIAQSVLMGLSAGAQTPPQRSKGAAWGAGIGAGADAQRQQAQQQDQLKRGQAAEEYERAQKELTDKAVRAAHNASTYSLWTKAMDEQNDHDPERKKNMDIVDSINEYNSRNPQSGLSAQIVTPEAAMAIREGDKHSVGKHTFLPLGMTEAKDADGKPVFEQDGITPHQTGQIAVISGTGNIPLPASFVSDAKEYGKLAGIGGADGLTAGQEVPLATFLTMDKRLNDLKRQEIDGWKNAKDVVLADGKTPGQMNAVTSKTRPYPEGAQPNLENKPAAQAAETNLKAGQTAEAWAKAREADAKALSEATGAKEETANQGIDLVEGTLVPSQLSKRSKSFNAVLKSADDYSKQKYGKPFDFEKAQRDYQFAQNVGTQNTLKYLNSLTGNSQTGEKGNLQLLVDISNGVDRSDFPAINDLDAWEKLQTGDPKYIPLYNVAVDVSDQFAKIMAGGGSGNVTSDKKIEQGMRMFRTGFSKPEVQAAASSTLQMLANRKREFIGSNRYLQKDYGASPEQRNLQEPSGWTHKATAADGKTTIYLMPDKSIQDAQGNKYDSSGNLLKGTK
jgi:hypothetical protein